jgi:hypothetical protein
LQQILINERLCQVLQKLDGMALIARSGGGKPRKYRRNAAATRQTNRF